jgi:hypothetical protein
MSNAIPKAETIPGGQISVRNDTEFPARIGF